MTTTEPAAASAHPDSSRHPSGHPRPVPSGIAARLREGTQTEHRQAESQPFVHDLMSGRLDVRDYTAMVAAHVQIYRVLEDAVAAARQHPWCSSLFDPALDRADRLAEDLGELCALDGSEPPATGPAVQRYVERIRSVRDDPVRLIGHHYIRYLGDMSGGQAIAAMVRRHITTSGLSFYDFADLRPLPRYKQRYRVALDALPLDDAQVEVLIDEVRLAFGCNSDVFGELGGALVC